MSENTEQDDAAGVRCGWECERRHRNNLDDWLAKEVRRRAQGKVASPVMYSIDT